MSEISGSLYSIGSVEKVTDSFSKVLVVVYTDEQYPQKIAIEFVNKKIDLLKNFRVGQIVKINYNLRGREWTDKNTGELRYFNTVQGWRIEKIGEPTVPADEMPEPFPTVENNQEPEEYDDLPF